MRHVATVLGTLLIAMPAGIAMAQAGTPTALGIVKSAAAGAVPEPIVAPVSLFTSDDYPPSALRNAEEGRVTFSIDVDAKGLPVRCNVITSSGSNALDTTTCSVVMQRGRFTPATRAGKPVPGTAAPVSVIWKLPKDGFTLPKGQGVTTIDHEVEYALNTRGEVTSCTVIRNAVPGMDPCQGAPIGKVMTTPPPQRDGQPVTSTMRTTVKVVMTAD